LSGLQRLARSEGAAVVLEAVKDPTALAIQIERMKVQRLLKAVCRDYASNT